MSREKDDEKDLAERGEPPVRGGRGTRAPALLAILCMTFMETLDGTIVNVALPTMQAELGVGATQIQLVASVFLVVTCAFLLVFGRLGDIVGKVRVFQAGERTGRPPALLAGAPRQTC